MAGRLNVNCATRRGLPGEGGVCLSLFSAAITDTTDVVINHEEE
jgi:hypothetical protein